MPAFPPVALDDVEASNQRSFAERQTVLSASLIRQNAGDQTLAESSRQNFALFNQAQNAVIAQALLGSDPTLEASILAARAAQAQPQTTGTLVSPGVFSGVPAPGDTTPAQTKT